MSEFGKIDAAKEAAMRILDILPDGSFVSLYTFSDVVKNISRCKSLDNPFRKKLKSSISKMKASGMTDMYGALESAISDLSEAGEGGQPLRLFLLTDGMPTVGVTEPEKFYDIMRDICKLGVEAIFFGIGEDYNEDLLYGMVEACGQGCLEHIVQSDIPKIPEVMTKYAERAATVLARNIKIHITKLPEDAIKILTDLRVSSDEKGVVIDVGDLSADQEKRFYGQFIIAPRRFKGRYRVASVEVWSDNNMISSKDLIIEYTDDQERVMSKFNKEIIAKVEAIDALKRGDIDMLTRTLGEIKDRTLRRTLSEAVDAIEAGDRKKYMSLLSKTRAGEQEG